MHGRALLPTSLPLLLVFWIRSFSRLEKRFPLTCTPSAAELSPWSKLWAFLFWSAFWGRIKRSDSCCNLSAAAWRAAEAAWLWAAIEPPSTRLLSVETWCLLGLRDAPSSIHADARALLWFGLAAGSAASALAICLGLSFPNTTSGLRTSFVYCGSDMSCICGQGLLEPDLGWVSFDLAWVASGSLWASGQIMPRLRLLCSVSLPPKISPVMKGLPVASVKSLLGASWFCSIVQWIAASVVLIGYKKITR